MNTRITPVMVALLLNFSIAAGAVDEASGAQPPSQYLRVSVDRVVIDTQGLAQASTRLAASVDELAVAIGRLSSADGELSAEDRATIASAVQSADAAAAALRQLAEEIPRSAREFNDRLPRMISDAGQPIAGLSSSLQAAGNSVQLITESLPQATANARILANDLLDAVVLRLSIYTLLLFAALALAVIAVIWFIYIQYLGPLVRKLDEVTGAPQQFAEIARHMKETSDNLLRLERLAAPEHSPRRDD